MGLVTESDSEIEDGELPESTIIAISDLNLFEQGLFNNVWEKMGGSSVAWSFVFHPIRGRLFGRCHASPNA